MLITDLKILLASQSPRRKYILEEAGFSVEVITSNAEEILPDSVSIVTAPRYLAELKMKGVSVKPSSNEVVITADTIVVFDGEILGKPKTLEEAVTYLKRLSSNEHQVLTGVCIQSIHGTGSFMNNTSVKFYEITDEEIDYYLNRDEVLDKAGAYGVQDWIGWTKIKRIEGSYSNIMGLPMAETYQAIKNIFE